MIDMVDTYSSYRPESSDNYTLSSNDANGAESNAFTQVQFSGFHFVLLCFTP